MLKGVNEDEDEAIALVAQYRTLRSKGGDFESALAPRNGDAPSAVALRATAHNINEIAKSARRLLTRNALKRSSGSADALPLTENTEHNLTVIAEELEVAAFELLELADPQAVFNDLDTNAKHDITARMPVRNLDRVAQIHARIKGETRKQKDAEAEAAKANRNGKPK